MEKTLWYSLTISVTHHAWGRADDVIIISATASAQVIQCNTVQNHLAEAVIRKYNTSTECTSLKVLIKDTTVSRSTAYNIQIFHIHDICLLVQKSIQIQINTTCPT